MMKAGWRILIAAAALAMAGASGTASAQNAVTPAPPSNESDVGPSQLRDFTLNGTVTRPSATPPAAQTPRPAPSSPAPATQAPITQSSSTTALPPPRAPSGTSPPPPARRSVTVELPPPSPSAELPAASVAPTDEPTGQALADTFAPAPAPAPGLEQGPSILPWLLAAIMVGAGAAFYFLRIRPRAQLAGGPEMSQFSAPDAPQPQPRVPTATPPTPAPPANRGGVVSTRLRPWIEIEFVPERTIVDGDKVALEFVVTLYNSGSAPARDVLIEAGMFNASPAQDREIAAFFGNPVGRGDRVPVIAPLQRVVVRSAVTLPRSQVRPLEMEGRPLLVPLAGFNALYRWGSNGQGQTSASYLVGKETKGEKLAPFRLDLGPRVFRGLAAREHQLRVRK
jgi:hypothetical protein